jgi:hypothetical protein
MGIVNRRYAVLGWAVWQVGKRVAEQKARAAARADRTSRRPSKAAMIATLAALAGILMFWRKKSDSTPPAI